MSSGEQSEERPKHDITLFVYGQINYYEYLVIALSMSR